jgi:glutamine synthetase
MSDAAGIVETIREAGSRAVVFRFTDLRGQPRHLARHAAGVDAALLEHGLLIDGSAIPGWRDVADSDVLLRPDLASAFQDPFAAQPTLVVLCDVADPASGVGYERDPRSVARRAHARLVESGHADEALCGAELAFYVLDDVQSAVGTPEVRLLADSPEATHNAARAYAAGNPGHRPPPRDGYLAAPPRDHQADLRQEVAEVLDGLGVGGLAHCHGRSPGQGLLTFEAQPLVAACDRVQLARWVIHNVAATYGKTATFLPKPLPDAEGSGLHVQLALRREGRPLFGGNGYADLSELCLHAIGGIIHHARALNAFTNPTTNSYRRLAPGLEAPSLLAYAAHNRSAALRVPYATEHAGKRIEVRFPDAAANPYLAFAALLMAALDGIERRLDPGEAIDRNLYDLPPEETGALPTACRSLREALEALEQDHDFLTRGEVMPGELIEAYIALRMEEVEALERTPHPLEYQLYYSV